MHMGNVIYKNLDLRQKNKTEFCKCQKLHQLSFISLTFASQQMTWPKFVLKSCKRLRELSPEHDSSLLTQLSFCDINKGPWYKFSLYSSLHLRTYVLLKWYVKCMYIWITNLRYHTILYTNRNQILESFILKVSRLTKTIHSFQNLSSQKVSHSSSSPKFLFTLWFL